MADIVTALVFIGTFSLTQHLDQTSTLEMVATVPLWPLVAKIAGLYDNDHRTLRHLTPDELPALLLWVLASGIVSILLVIGSGFVVADAVLSVGTTSAAAICLRPLARFLWRRAVPPARFVLVGTPTLAATTKRKLELFPDIHAVVIAELTLEEAMTRLRNGAALAPGTIHRVVIASASPTHALVDDLLVFCRSHGAKLSLVQPPNASLGRFVRATSLADLAVLEYNTLDVLRSTMVVKRALDIVVAAVAIVVLLPVFAIIALGIRVSDAGPIIYRQRRAGRGGGIFKIWKFRTMVVDAEERLQEFVRFDELEQPAFKLSSDPRVTSRTVPPPM